eukprot:GEMP01075254.1.p1 GENE.GEMP01075254.1~~GEMP01075254.1.p1  ORF type:complete len:217 (+),score=4.93 GEMP01075254.1:161-811(+)
MLCILWASFVVLGSVNCFSFQHVPSMAMVGDSKPYSKIMNCGQGVHSCILMVAYHRHLDFYIPDYEKRYYSGGCGPVAARTDLKQASVRANYTRFPCVAKTSATRFSNFTETNGTASSLTTTTTITTDLARLGGFKNQTVNNRVAKPSNESIHYASPTWRKLYFEPYNLFPPLFTLATFFVKKISKKETCTHTHILLNIIKNVFDQRLNSERTDYR